MRTKAPPAAPLLKRHDCPQLDWGGRHNPREGKPLGSPNQGLFEIKRFESRIQVDSTIADIVLKQA